jgi:hypothetical protein
MSATMNGVSTGLEEVTADKSVLEPSELLPQASADLARNESFGALGAIPT